MCQKAHPKASAAPSRDQDLQAHSHPRSESPFCHAAAVNGWLRLLAASAIRSTACSPPQAPLPSRAGGVLIPRLPPLVPSSSRPCCAVRGTAPPFDLDAGPIQEPGRPVLHVELVRPLYCPGSDRGQPPFVTGGLRSNPLHTSADDRRTPLAVPPLLIHRLWAHLALVL